MHFEVNYTDCRRTKFKISKMSAPAERCTVAAVSTFIAVFGLVQCMHSVRYLPILMHRRQSPVSHFIWTINQFSRDRNDCHLFLSVCRRKETLLISLAFSSLSSFLPRHRLRFDSSVGNSALSGNNSIYINFNKNDDINDKLHQKCILKNMKTNFSNVVSFVLARAHCFSLDDSHEIPWNA